MRLSLKVRLYVFPQFKKKSVLQNIKVNTLHTLIIQKYFLVFGLTRVANKDVKLFFSKLGYHRNVAILDVFKVTYSFLCTF